MRSEKFFCEKFSKNFANKVAQVEEIARAAESTGWRNSEGRRMNHVGEVGETPRAAESPRWKKFFEQKNFQKNTKKWNKFGHKKTKNFAKGRKLKKKRN